MAKTAKEPKSKLPFPIGEDVARVDTVQKVAGTAIFTDDLRFGPDLLYARLKRSPHPHALIKSIDTSKAEKLPGVKIVVTGRDFDQKLGLYLVDRPVFCRDRVRYIGDPVAGVAAISEEIAEKALELIEVEYEPLEPVFDPVYGASEKAPLLHADLGKYQVAPFIFPRPGTNISNHFKIRKGNIEEGFAKCKDGGAIIEREYWVPHVQHVPIEPHVAIAQTDHDGKITLWSSSQSPFAQRNMLAKCFGKSEGDIRVISPLIGGGFGCKAGITMEAFVVAISLKLPGRPIKLRLTREEEFYTAAVRQGLVLKLKIGCDKDGMVQAMENTLYWDGGAYNDYGVNITRAGGYSSSGPYDIPNVKTDSICVYTNHPVGSAFRGFGMSELHTGIGQVMDELAHEIGMDPVKFQLKNCLKGGETTVTGGKMHPIGLPQAIEKVAKAIDWGKKPEASAPNKRRGKGIAIMWKAPAMPPNPGSSAWIKMNEDGTATLSVSGQELGQGFYTVAAQFVAAGLGIPVEDVHVEGPIDTKYSPYEWQTVASRITWSAGNAILRAAADAKKQILETVATAWDEDIEDLDIIDGKVVSYKSEETLPLKNIAVYGIAKPGDAGWWGGPVVGRGSFMPTYVTGLDPETGQGPRSVVHFTTGAQAVEIEVDMDTGRVEILRVASAFDVGRAINPQQVKMQVEGGAVQGLSTSIFEELKLKEGVVQNPSFVDYRIATIADIPGEIIADYVEVPQDDGPFGARGVGEHPMVPSIAAMSNALYDALGIRIGSPPFSAEKVYLAIEEHGLDK